MKLMKFQLFREKNEVPKHQAANPQGSLTDWRTFNGFGEPMFRASEAWLVDVCWCVLGVTAICKHLFDSTYITYACITYIYIHIISIDNNNTHQYLVVCDVSPFYPISYHVANAHEKPPQNTIPLSSCFGDKPTNIPTLLVLPFVLLLSTLGKVI